MSSVLFQVDEATGEHVVDATKDMASGSAAPDPDAKLAQHDPVTRVYPMVMSIGWNLFYKNMLRSVEVHIMHDFDGRDFYGAHMNLVVLGFIRPELDYVSKEKLIEDIRTDIDVASKSLERPAYAHFAEEESLSLFQGLEPDEAAS